MRHQIHRQDIFDYLRKDHKSTALDHCIQNASLTEAWENLREIEKFRKIYCNPNASLVSQVATEAIEEAKDGITEGSKIGATLGLGTGIVGGYIQANVAAIELADKGELGRNSTSFDIGALSLGVVLGWGGIIVVMTMVGTFGGATIGGTVGLISGGTHGLFARCVLKKLDEEQIQMVLKLEAKAQHVVHKLETNPVNKPVYSFS